MEDKVLIVSSDADFCVFVGHVLAQSGFGSRVIDPADGIDDDALRATQAIIVASNDDMDVILAFCRRVRAVPPPQSGRPLGRKEPEGRQPDALTTRDDTRQLIGHGGSIHLTPTEYRLLKRLLANPGQVVSRRQLIEAAWPAARHVEPRTVDVHIGKLRQALVMTTGRRVIRTIRSSGFVAELPGVADCKDESC